MLIISASNVSRSGENSQSLAAAHRIHDLLLEKGRDSLVLDLRRFRIEPCDMCEGCAGDGLCVKDDDFNALNRLWMEHETLVFVCPHYAGIPSKLVAMIEKIQEMSYLGYCQGRKGAKARKALVIAHGGMTESFEELYRSNLITPLSNMLKSAGCKVLNEGIPEPLCFGVKAYHEERDQGSCCYRKDDDLERREAIIRLGVERLFEA